MKGRKMKTSKIIMLSVAALLIFCPLALAEDAKASEKRPYENHRIDVNTYLVKADMNSLYEMGVGYIGDKESINPIKLAACIAQKSGEVIGGIVWSVMHGRATRTSFSKDYPTENPEITPSGRTSPGNRRRPVHKGDLKIGLHAKTTIIEKDIIYIEGSYSVHHPPDDLDLSWEGHSYLKPGRPKIVASAQDSNYGYFLVIIAKPEKLN
jgi:hypothetical protein